MSSEGNDEEDEDEADEEDGGSSGSADSLQSRSLSPSWWSWESGLEDSDGCAPSTTEGCWHQEEVQRWVGGLWPVERPLPLPMWGRRQPKEVGFSDVEEYENLASNMELQVQLLLKAHNYNTVGNFLRFYDSFISSDWDEQDLEGYFRKYQPLISAEHHTCVGLGLELIKRLSEIFAHIKESFFLASCEETIEESEKYVGTGGEPCQWTAEKEHVLVGLRISVKGRKGVMLLDPGYHIARAITVMQDCSYPHTGWFTQMDEPHCKKEYLYSSCGGGAYVTWKVKETRPIVQSIDAAQGCEPGVKVAEHLSLVYIGLPFLNPVSVTERRNLVYDFKSLLHRDAKGHLEAGLYFSLNQPNFHKAGLTLFYRRGGVRHQTKIPFSHLDGTQGTKMEDSEERIEFIDEVGRQLGMPTADFYSLLSQLAMAMKDKSFLEQLLGINNAINEIAANN